LYAKLLLQYIQKYLNILKYIEWHCCGQWGIILINSVIFNGRYFIHSSAVITSSLYMYIYMYLA
jgi:hypothetical protein